MPFRKATTAKLAAARRSASKVCELCRCADDDPLQLGQLRTKHGLTVHHYCLLFSSGLAQAGRKDTDGIDGFLTKDILAEKRRGTRLKCRYCRRPGATIGCNVARCRVSFHLPCGRRHHTFHRFGGNFESLCVEHRPVQRKRKLNNDGERCSICDEPRDVNTWQYTTIYTGCCFKWIHRDCIQQQALSAGRHHFRCPFCNDRKSYLNVMKNNGIDIPVRDASWEVIDGFQELLERPSKCVADECLCPDGREFNAKSGEKLAASWEMIVCAFCAYQGVHRRCGRLQLVDRQPACDTCLNALSKVEKKKVEEEPKKKSLPAKNQKQKSKQIKAKKTKLDKVKALKKNKKATAAKRRSTRTSTREEPTRLRPKI